MSSDTTGAGGVTDSAAFWENHYAGVDAQWGTRPNAVLAEVITALAPAPGGGGRALDLGCGHGGDALWLASLGWHVAAVDVSTTALGRVTAGAAAAGLTDRVHPSRHDLARSFPDGTFGLVTASYFHTPVEIPREQVLRRAAEAVAPAACSCWSSTPRSPPGPGGTATRTYASPPPTTYSRPCGSATDGGPSCATRPGGPPPDPAARPPA